MFAHLTIFFEIQILDEIELLRRETLGLQNRVRFENDIFHIFPGKRKFEKFLACGCVKSRVRVVVVSKHGLAVAVRSIFRGLGFDTVFAKLKWSSSHPPLFVLVFCLFVRTLLGIGVNAALHVWFWAIGPKPFFYKKTHWFAPWKKGYSCSFFSLSLSFSLASFASPFSLSLSIYLYIFLSLSLSLSISLFLPSFIFHSLFFSLLFFLSCLVSLFGFMKEQHQMITFERFVFINPFCLFGFPVLFCLSVPFSYLCVFPYPKLCVLVNVHVLSFEEDHF